MNEAHAPTAVGKMTRHDASRVGDPMTTFTGKRFYPLDPRAGEVDILDIAQALSNQARYGGHCRFYSVAEHSVLVSHLVPPKLALAGLLHDASECYTNDLTRPMKRALGKDSIFFKIEAMVYAAIAERFDIPKEVPVEVNYADNQILVIEKEVLHPRSEPWDLPYPRPLGINIRCLNPEKARSFFIHRYCQLTGLSYDTVWGLSEALQFGA